MLRSFRGKQFILNGSHFAVPYTVGLAPVEPLTSLDGSVEKREDNLSMVLNYHWVDAKEEFKKKKAQI